MKKGKHKLRIIILIIASFGLVLNSNAQERIVEQLNDAWQFVLLEDEIDYISLSDTSWQDVQIPHTWNNKDIQSGKKVHYGTAWYRRELLIESENPNKQYFLRFDGVGQYAEFFINGKYVSQHLGSYSAFVFNITRFIDFDKTNTILVKVNNELTDSYPKDNFLFGIYGGIYRDVSLISTGSIHIALTDNASSGIFVSSGEVNKKNASLKIVTELKNETSVKQLITIKNKLFSADNKKVAESIKEILLYPGGLVPITSHLEVKNPHLWNGRKDPYLYRLETAIIKDDEMVDKFTQQTGIRFFSVDPEKGFILNGEPYRLYGVCRHQEWQDLGNALLPKHHKKDMDLIYELGATSIRLAHYQQADYIYSLADSMGILVWAEIPFVNGYNENADGNALQQLTELIKQNYNHPSIFVWGLHNEVIKNGIVAKAVNLTNKLQNLAKELNPSRYTVAVSNIWWVYDHPIHQLADLQGFNQYAGWYGGKPEELNNWIQKYHLSKPDIRFSVSEYGAGGNIDQQTDDISTPPNPTGQFFPESYQTYYHEVTYSAIEKAPFIWSSYIWNMFDFSVPEWNRGGIKGRNHKGLVTYDRKIKKDAFYWYKANWSNEPVLYLTGRRNNPLETNVKSFTAYSNIGTPELLINGKSYGKMAEGINHVHFVSKEIVLEKGENKIEIRVDSDNNQYQDDYELIIETPENE
jgi:beta-galactosidase